MRRLAVFLACLAGPALAGGLEIEVVGETVSGTVQIDLLEDVAPLHAAQISALAEQGAYDGVVFHRVIEGFMAQTGDVRFGKNPQDMSRAGMGAPIWAISQPSFQMCPLIAAWWAWPARKIQTVPTVSFSSCLSRAISSTGNIRLSDG